MASAACCPSKPGGVGRRKLGFRLLNLPKSESGTVTAEFAVNLPSLIFVGVGLALVLVLGLAQLRVSDAASAAARLLARGESVQAANLVAKRIAGRPAQVQVSLGDEFVRTKVILQVRGPSFLRFISTEVSATAVAIPEPSS